MKYRPIYKCRLCGTRYGVDRIDDLKNIDTSKEVHQCIDGGVGLADFIGFEPVENRNGTQKEDQV